MASASGTLISRPRAWPIGGGTALPILLYLSRVEQENFSPAQCNLIKKLELLRLGGVDELASDRPVCPATAEGEAGTFFVLVEALTCAVFLPVVLTLWGLTSACFPG